MVAAGSTDDAADAELAAAVVSLCEADDEAEVDCAADSAEVTVLLSLVTVLSLWLPGSALLASFSLTLPVQPEISSAADRASARSFVFNHFTTFRNKLDYYSMKLFMPRSRRKSRNSS